MLAPFILTIISPYTCGILKFSRITGMLIGRKVVLWSILHWTVYIQRNSAYLLMATFWYFLKPYWNLNFHADCTWQSRLPHTCGIIFYSSLQKSFTSIPSSLSYSSTNSSSKRPFGKVIYMAFFCPEVY